MATIKKFEDLEAWQLSRELSKRIFLSTKKATFNKDFELINQINRSSGSAMDNITEGFGWGGRNEFVNSLSITTGSLCEVKSQLYRATDREYISQEEFDALYTIAESACNKAGNLIQYLNRATYSGQKFKGLTSNNKP